jgi:HlyD family secretion protein
MPMTRRTAFMLAAGTLVLAALLAWAFVPRPVTVEAAPVGLGPFEAGIDEEGRTRLRDRYVVSAPIAGRLQRPLLREGDAVRAGDVVGRLRPLLPVMLDERARREQQAHAQAADAAWQAAQARVGVARLSAERADGDWRRTESLVQQGFVSEAKTEGDRLARDAARAEWQAAQEAERAARFEREAARAALVSPTSAAVVAGDEATRADAVLLRAPVAGRVLKLHQASEATVAAGTPVLELGNVGALEVVVELLTGDALQVRPGSGVRIERWGGPQALSGTVRSVEPAGFTKVSALGVEEQRVRVLIELTSPPVQWASLGDGFRVGVRVVTRQAERVLRVPVGAVFPRPAGLQADDGCPAPQAGEPATLESGCVATFVVEGGRAHLRAVRLEARETRFAWVRAGLRDGESVIVYPAAAVADGVRVAVRTVTKAP